MGINEKMKTVADKIRYYTTKEDKLTLDSMVTEIDVVNQIGFENGVIKGRDEGYETGYTEGETAGIEQGTETEKKRFWQNYQNRGNRSLWQYAFYDYYWNDTIYEPIYDMNVQNAQYMFTSSSISNTKVAINITAPGDAYRTFYNCTRLHTIPKLSVVEGLTYNSAFYNCNALKNIVIEGIVGNGLDMHWSPLTKESITSVINALSSTTTGRTLTLQQAAVATAFETSEGAADGSTSEEWATLVASKSNWTISLV